MVAPKQSPNSLEADVSVNRQQSLSRSCWSRQIWLMPGSVTNRTPPVFMIRRNVATAAGKSNM